MPIAQGFKRKGLIQIFWAQPAVSTDHPYLTPSEICGNFSLSVNAYQISSACVYMKERRHIAAEILYFFHKIGPSKADLSTSENTFDSEGLHLLQFADGWVLFFNPGEVSKGFQRFRIHSLSTYLREHTTFREERMALASCHRAGVKAMS